ncbi:MAG: sulfotransferase family protein [Thermoleophilaceae bacterium]
MLDAQTAHVPAPFIVGVARSGTTLLRLQLDAHPDLAIPPETYFGSVLRGLATRNLGPAELLDAIWRLPHRDDFGIGREELATRFEEIPEWTPGEGLRAYFGLYAARWGKRRWGEKTPAHCLHMDLLAEHLPEARFIHIVRDGRDVAASLRGLPFAPGDGSIEAIATTWRGHIRRARELAQEVPHYREVRYEQLVSEPELVLREVCAFIELPFDSVMLRAHERADRRLEELKAVRRANGTVRRPEQRKALHALTRQPPDASRWGRWRSALSEREVARFQAVAGDLLVELGYEPPRGG